METYTISFYGKNDVEPNEMYIFTVAENENFFDRLEEELYIAQELTPNSVTWANNLLDLGNCRFNFHRVQNVYIEWIEGSSEILAIDL